MLVLSGTEGQKFIIAEGVVEVEILEVIGNKVRLGFVASPDIRIDRQIIHERRMEGNHD